jgi:hypothetical protein
MRKNTTEAVDLELYSNRKHDKLNRTIQDNPDGPRTQRSRMGKAKKSSVLAHTPMVNLRNKN